MSIKNAFSRVFIPFHEAGERLTLSLSIAKALLNCKMPKKYNKVRINNVHHFAAKKKRNTSSGILGKVNHFKEAR
ncbi:MAG: hypothetical protein WCG27_04310 [Pseudomonadota bacterium]